MATIKLKIKATIILVFSILFTANAIAEYKEYGIALLPEENCGDMASKINLDIASHIPDAPNLNNNWHVTLYQIALSEKDVNKVYEYLKYLKKFPVKIIFNGIKTTQNKWIDLEVRPNKQLQKLHEQIVHKLHIKHKRPLLRIKANYYNLTKSQKKQVDKFGMPGILSYYRPHMSLFYSITENRKLEYVTSALENKFNRDIRCKFNKIAIGEIGYAGNLHTILHVLDLPE